MRLTVLLSALALCACSRGFSPDTDEPDPAPPAHAHAGAHDTPSGLPHGHPPIQLPVGDPGSPHPAVPTTPGAPSAGGLTWTADAPLAEVQPDTPARSAQYAVHGAAGDATLAV